MKEVVTERGDLLLEEVFLVFVSEIEYAKQLIYVLPPLIEDLFRFYCIT